MTQNLKNENKSVTTLTNFSQKIHNHKKSPQNRKSIFIKGKFQNFTKQIYSILIWEGIFIEGVTENKIDFLRTDFSLSSYAYYYNNLKYNDSAKKYFEAIKQSRIETITNHTKIFSYLQKSLIKKSENIDAKESIGIKSLIQEIEQMIESAYKEVFFGSRFNLNFSYEFLEETDLIESRMEKLKTNEENQEEKEKLWENIPESSEILETTPVIDPVKGIPSGKLRIGDQIWISPLSNDGSIQEQEYHGIIKEIVRDPNVGIRVLVKLKDFEENNIYGDLELKNPLNIKSVVKGNENFKEKEMLEEYEDIIPENFNSSFTEMKMKNSSFSVNSFLYLLILISFIFFTLLYFFI